MTASNQVRLTAVKETTPGTTPGTPRMRTVRVTGESLAFTNSFLDSDELRSDRMNVDPIQVMQESGGGINFEMAYPDQDSPLSVMLESALWSSWTNTPARDNDGTADSVITDVNSTGGVVTVSGVGGTFAVGHLVKLEGFTNSANNVVARVTTSSATVPAFSGAGLVSEPVPPATAKMKVVGAAGVSGDVSANATGLTSVSLIFTALGLSVGQWIKIGGTAV